MYKDYYRKVYLYSFLLHLVLILFIWLIVFIVGFIMSDKSLFKYLSSSDFVFNSILFGAAYLCFLLFIYGFNDVSEIKFGDFGKSLYLCDHGYELKDYIYNIKTVSYNTGDKIYVPTVIIGDGVPPKYISKRLWALCEKETEDCVFLTKEDAMMAIVEWRKHEEEMHKETNKTVEAEEVTSIKFDAK